ncbi:hypothetical protein IEQ34_005650 [Dendrobium chrysotoxum]|uniref:C2H2-type domain-containing protein n=1 Tax=Dendrobium chrysotoxum TaxID=161865 RepID=A0AAV7HAS7_DENCH|nr:hypothetical protein IEQ34_005650 [Dendrobium chrysotoxum]
MIRISSGTNLFKKGQNHPDDHSGHPVESITAYQLPNKNKDDPLTILYDQCKSDPFGLDDLNIGSILCCICGISMLMNPANMCIHRMHSHVDITEGLQCHTWLIYYPECHNYLGLLIFGLHHLNPLSHHIRIINNEPVWTESHSKRIKPHLHMSNLAASNMFLPLQIVGSICYICGTSMPPNPTNM